MTTFARDCWFLTGPTASGKTRLAVTLAERLGAEIVALDSMTLYREMDIGTAKPTAAERARARHHLLDVLDPAEPSNLDRYLKMAGDATRDILGRGKRVLFVGGSPLYLKALLRGFFEGPGPDERLRAELEEEARSAGTETLHARLATIDAAAAAKIHPGDLRRIVRALEVYHATGRPLSQQQREFDRPANPPPAAACLLPDRAENYERINRRVLAMLDAGWIDETRRLLDRPGGLSREARQAVGYREIAEHFAGRLAREEMINLIQTRTRQFAKRQRGWFRHLEELTVFPLAPGQDVEELVDPLEAWFRDRSEQSD